MYDVLSLKLYKAEMLEMVDVVVLSFKSASIIALESNMPWDYII